MNCQIYLSWTEMASWKCPLLHHSDSWRTCSDTYLSLRKYQFVLRECKCLELRFPNSHKGQQVVDLYLTQCLFITHLKYLITFSQCFHQTCGFDPKSVHTSNMQITHLDHLEFAFEGWKLSDKLSDDILRMMQLFATGHLRWEKAAFSYTVSLCWCLAKTSSWIKKQILISNSQSLSPARTKSFRWKLYC